MKLANPKAFTPFMTEAIILRNFRRGSVDTLTLNASVAAGNPYAATSGESASCSQYSVSVSSADIITNQSIVQGSTVEADPFGQWPELTIQRIYKLGGLTIFDCSANEQGARS